MHTFHPVLLPGKIGCCIVNHSKGAEQYILKDEMAFEEIVKLVNEM